MTLSRLSIQHLRNLSAVEITPSAYVNCFYGANGSGKTSMLEAISMLGMGRSFRTHKHKTLITEGQSRLTVFAELFEQETTTTIPMGLSRSLQGDVQFKLRGENVSSAADLASCLPIQVINSDTFSLLEGGPQFRRQFLDWLVFHVEPLFFPCWKQAERCLKHRNSLLRHGRIDPLELEPWDQELARLSTQIDAYRLACFERFETVFNELIPAFMAVEGIKLSYYSGWDKSTEYVELLRSQRESDRRIGYTQRGAHRADLKITLGKMPAADILSRGQQKLLVCALKIAQGLVFSELTGRRCIYLVDDLPAELDYQYRHLLAEWLHKMNTQVFVTGVEQALLSEPWQHLPDLDLKMFHVEQGKVTAVSESAGNATDFKSGE